MHKEQLVARNLQQPLPQCTQTCPVMPLIPGLLGMASVSMLTFDRTTGAHIHLVLSVSSYPEVLWCSIRQQRMLFLHGYCMDDLWMSEALPNGLSSEHLVQQHAKGVNVCSLHKCQRHIYNTTVVFATLESAFASEQTLVAAEESFRSSLLLDIDTSEHRVVPCSRCLH